MNGSMMEVIRIKPIVLILIVQEYLINYLCSNASPLIWGRSGKIMRIYGGLAP